MDVKTELSKLLILNFKSLDDVKQKNKNCATPKKSCTVVTREETDRRNSKHKEKRMNVVTISKT